MRLEVAFEAFEAFDRRCRRECVGSRRRSFFAAARARRRETRRVFQIRDASSNRPDDAREIPRRNSAVCDLRSESEADAEATAAAAAALSPPRPSESDAKREWHRATFSSASASSTETTVLQHVCEILFFRRVVVFAARDEDAPRRRENATAFSSSSSSHSSAVSSKSTSHVSSSESTHATTASRAKPSFPRTRTRAPTATRGFADDARRFGALASKGASFSSKASSRSARRAAAAEGSSLFVPGKQNSSVLPRHGAQERRARLDVLRRGGCEIASPEPKRAPGVGSCRGAPRGLDDGIFVFVSGTTTSAATSAASASERSRSSTQGPRNASETSSCSEPSFQTSARARLTRDRVPAASASPSSTSATNASSLSSPSLGSGYRRRAHAGLPGERHGLAVGRKRHLRGLHGAHARADRGRPRRRHQQRDGSTRARATDPSDARRPRRAPRDKEIIAAETVEVDATSAVPSTRRAHRPRAPAMGPAVECSDEEIDVRCADGHRGGGVLATAAGRADGRGGGKVARGPRLRRGGVPVLGR